MRGIEELARLAIDCGFHIHRDIGPGALESVYEAILAAKLEQIGVGVRRQVILPIDYDGLVIADGFRIDLLLDDRLIVEVKSVEKLAPVHAKQVLTYIRLARQPLGLLMNFGGETFREGLRRIVNGKTDLDFRQNI